MRFDENFEVSGGSVSGRSHVLAGKPNQDAYASRVNASGLCAIVCDGCGSGARSEIGAVLGARIITEKVMKAMADGQSMRDEKTWERIRLGTLDALAMLVDQMGESKSSVVTDYFLFTVMGVVLSKDDVVIFGIGDGMYALNGEIAKSGPFPGNAPPYLGYGLLRDGPAFSIHGHCALDEFDTALVGTDGLIDYEAAVGKSYPSGRGEKVTPISQFWEEDKYFRNEDALRRMLHLVNREVTRPIWNEKRLVKEPGLLEDDTTLMVVRKKRLVTN